VVFLAIIIYAYFWKHHFHILMILVAVFVPSGKGVGNTVLVIGHYTGGILLYHLRNHCDGFLSIVRYQEAQVVTVPPCATGMYIRSRVNHRNGHDRYTIIERVRLHSQYRPFKGPFNII